jgi:hypothetical protein
MRNLNLIQSYIQHIFKKLQVQVRAKVVRYFFKRIFSITLKKRFVVTVKMLD